MIQLLLTEFVILIFLPFPGSNSIQTNIPARLEKVCSDCHSDMVEYEVMHLPAKNACDLCHESTGEVHPGESMGFKQLDQPTGLCLSCHDRSYTTDTSITINIKRLVMGKMLPHSAIEAGGCLMCHQAHGSDNRKLLVDLYPADNYLTASTEAFGLCFLCHDTDILDAEETEWGTNFRNGSQNLHWLHIKGNKGRNCRMCHNLHGSEQKFLIETRLGFGNWEMDMNFIPEDQGGSCFPGCHGKLSYSR